MMARSSRAGDSSPVDLLQRRQTCKRSQLIALLK
jgi:hypothetical protein